MYTTQCNTVYLCSCNNDVEIAGQGCKSELIICSTHYITADDACQCISLLHDEVSDADNEHGLEPAPLLLCLHTSDTLVMKIVFGFSFS